ncbi:MAG: oligosaccharide flippase family protein [bacterium]
MDAQSPSAPRPILNTEFLSSSSIVFAGSFVVNVLNYIFTLLISRLMGVEEFGEVAALLSLLLIILVPASALAMLMAREAASRSQSHASATQELFFYLHKHVLLAAGGLWVLFLLATPLLSHLLHIPLLPFIIFSLLIPVAGLSALQSGTLQGLQEFFSLAKQSVLGAVIKLGVSIALVLAGYSVAGVMVALVLAQLASWGYGHFATRGALEHPADATSGALSGQYIRSMFGMLLLTTLLLVLLSSLDMLLAKHFLSATLAGQYGALSTVGKIILFGVGAFTTVLLPMASAAHARGAGEEKRLLALSLSITAGAVVSAWAVFSLFPTTVVTVLFGVRYLPIAPVLGTISIAMGCIALSTALINYFIAIRNTSFMYLLGLGIIFEVFLIALNHSSLAAIVNMLVISSVILLVLMGGNYFMTHKPRTT